MAGLTATEVTHAIDRMAETIAQRFDLDATVFIGIHTLGFPLAQRLADVIKARRNKIVPVGALDIALYRDDLNTGNLPYMRQTDIAFDLTGKTVILVDDVLFSGRTIRAALTAILELGRPQKIEVAVLIDRGHRELPILASVVGATIQTMRADHVRVQLSELHGKDEVVVN